MPTYVIAIAEARRSRWPWWSLETVAARQAVPTRLALFPNQTLWAGLAGLAADARVAPRAHRAHRTAGPVWTLKKREQSVNQ
jgi:hypothetical protein